MMCSERKFFVGVTVARVSILVFASTGGRDDRVRLPDEDLGNSDDFFSQ
jgi:hypothetical protein